MAKKNKPRPQFDMFKDAPLMKSIAFHKFDFKHPEVYKSFTELVLIKLKNGEKHGSAKQLFDELQEEGTKTFKSHQPYYVRKFVKEFPQHKAFFECRKTKYTTAL